MVQQPAPPPEVFSGREIARAAGVPPRVVADLIRAGHIPVLDGQFVAAGEAVAAVRHLRTGGPGVVVAALPALFARPRTSRRPTGLPLAASGTLHAAGLAVLLLLSALGATRPQAVRHTAAAVPPARLVFLSVPGPGGGGGGGGQLTPEPPPVATRKGPSSSTSPVSLRRLQKPASQSIPPAARPRPVAPVAPPRTPPPVLLLDHEALPPVLAPVVSLGADSMNRIGSVADSASGEDSQGPGTGGGTGSGDGNGLGEGIGPGIGPGTGGGTGGGPYRPGSGIEPPRLRREVRPRFTEAARQQGVEGEVLLEIVVRRDGRVGDVRVLDGLGAGLDQRAVEAVRQWEFEPARRLGIPVDVLVEVAVEFRLR